MTQKDEPLRHSGDMTRALEQVSQAVGDPDHVGPDRARHRMLPTENTDHPYSPRICPELIWNGITTLLPQMT